MSLPPLLKLSSNSPFNGVLCARLVNWTLPTALCKRLIEVTICQKAERSCCKILLWTNMRYSMIDGRARTSWLPSLSLLYAS